MQVLHLVKLRVRPCALGLDAKKNCNMGLMSDVNIKRMSNAKNQNTEFSFI